MMGKILNDRMLVGFPFLTNLETAKLAMTSWAQLSTPDKAVEFLVFDNSGDLKPDDLKDPFYDRNVTLVTHRENVGMPRLIHILQGVAATRNIPFCGMVHVDTFIWRKNWNVPITEAMWLYEKTAVVGLFGAPGVSAEGCRLGSYGNMTNLRDHGDRVTDEQPRLAAVVDGFAMFFNTPHLKTLVDCQYIEQGQYDYDICLEALWQGYQVRVVPLRCTHVSGITAATRTYEDYLNNKYPGGYEYVRAVNYERWLGKWGKRCPVLTRETGYEWKGEENAKDQAI
jgi:hypothetical protein